MLDKYLVKERTKGKRSGKMVVGEGRFKASLKFGNKSVDYSNRKGILGYAESGSLEL